MPVASQSLTESCELGVSSATIRNEMARLEQEKYITRPHLSAGSIPTDKGYRYYVESLTTAELEVAEQLLINHLFHQVERELGEWLRLAAALTAQLTQNVAIVTTPKPSDCRFKHLELVALRDSVALIVLVVHGARVRQQLITFDQVVYQLTLTTMANKLNTAYANLTSSEIQAKTIELSPLEQQVIDCILKMMQAESQQRYDEPYLDGLHFVFHQPEFALASRLENLMELIEHKRLLAAIMPPELGPHKVKVVIGKENKTEVIQDYSVVISQYGPQEEAVGTISVIGPTRMPYARAISTVSYLSLVLSQLVSDLYG